MMTFAEAHVVAVEYGRVDGMFDPFELLDADWREPRPELPVSFLMETLCAESFALMERTMGVPVDPAWFDTRLRTVLLASPDTLFEDPVAAWSP
ncbi:hypothetical protein [Streptomyces antibioticus]|uniref:hypothetical protein n=1 Tax=Streptomyces antibioticus TaxID=1890 RepID=UPI0033A4A3E7